MKYPTDYRVEECRLKGPADEPTGLFILKCGSARLTVQVSDGMGWDHASVSLKTRTPTWAELEFVRRAFFRDDETVMQLHVPAADHVNRHDFCLHLWRPQSDSEIAAIRERWKASGELWPYGDIESPGEIPRPHSIQV